VIKRGGRRGGRERERERYEKKGRGNRERTK